MQLRDSLVLTSLFVVTACPPGDSTTTDEPGTSDGTTATGGTTGTGTTAASTTDAPTTGTTAEPPDTTTGPGDTTAGSTDTTAGSTDTGSTDTTATTGDPDLVVETCADLHAEDPGAGDGEYTLYVDKDPNKPWTAYCHDMAGTPKDYLVLVNVADGRNFSQYATEGPGTTVHTQFTRVRIDPKTLVVDIDDVTFSESTGELMHGPTEVTSMPYGVAEACDGPNMANGLANIDLVGTPFKVIDPFCTKGASAAGEAVFSSGDQVVDLTGGGNCGWTGPTKGDMCVFDPQTKNSGFVLELAYIEAQPVLPETCADIKAGDPGAADGEYTLYVGKAVNQPWTAYCHDMAGEPREYLVLVNVDAGRNFSQYTASDPQQTDVVTRFTRVRIDPISLLVDIDDLTFSSSTGMLTHGADEITSMPYAVAEGCGGPDEAVGVGNVDLVGTPFRVSDMFCTKGATAAGNAASSAGAQVVDLTGGGFCGWTGPTKGNGCVDNPQTKNSGFVLELEYLPFLPETCAEVKAELPDSADGEYTLYIEGLENRPWTAYCHDMATTPKEYLPLVNVGDDRNFSQYTTTAQGMTTVRTNFTRVRIDPVTLVVDIDDLTFSSSTGMLKHGAAVITSMPYAVAEGCTGANNANGLANIDLVGTFFNVVDPFCTAGASAAGDAVFSAFDQVVDLTGGGGCGWTGPTKGNGCVDNPQNKSSGSVLELAYFNF